MASMKNCPACGADIPQPTPYCRKCGADIRSVQMALDKPDIATGAAGRDEVLRAIADKVREMKPDEDFSDSVKEILSEIEKTLQCKRSRARRDRETEGRRDRGIERSYTPSYLSPSVPLSLCPSISPSLCLRQTTGHRASPRPACRGIRCASGQWPRNFRCGVCASERRAGNSPVHAVFRPERRARSARLKARG